MAIIRQYLGNSFKKGRNRMDHCSYIFPQEEVSLWTEGGQSECPLFVLQLCQITT